MYNVSSVYCTVNNHGHTEPCLYTSRSNGSAVNTEQLFCLHLDGLGHHGPSEGPVCAMPWEYKLMILNIIIDIQLMEHPLLIGSSLEFPNCLCSICTRQLDLLLWRAGPTAQHTQD